MLNCPLTEVDLTFPANILQSYDWFLVYLFIYYLLCQYTWYVQRSKMKLENTAIGFRWKWIKNVIEPQRHQKKQSQRVYYAVKRSAYICENNFRRQYLRIHAYTKMRKTCCFVNIRKPSDSELYIDGNVRKLTELSIAFSISKVTQFGNKVIKNTETVKIAL